MTTETLHDLPAWRAAIARHRLVLLFKHSPVCPVSTAALREWEAFRQASPELPGLFVDVVADRGLARGLAEECGVRHESPQVILFRDGRPAWHASHRAITVEALQRATGG